MSTNPKYLFVVAKWSKDVGAYVATIDNKVAIITIDGKGKNAAGSTKVAGAEGADQKVARRKKVRQRAKSLTPEETDKAKELIAAGKTQPEVQAEIPGVVKNIYLRLKRLAATKPSPKKAATQKAVKKVPAKKAAKAQA